MKNNLLIPSPELMTREGLTDTVAPWEDGQRTDIDSPAFEWWYFDAHFDDGSTAVIVFLTKPMLEWKGQAKPHVMLTITRPNGDKIVKFFFSPIDQFSASKEICDVHVGANWVKGDLHQYQLHVEIDDLAADLTFTGIVPPWRPFAGKAYYADFDHYFAWLPAIPYGAAEGTLTYDGQVHKVTGHGYHDHNWGTIGLYDVTDHWYWGRIHVGDYSLIFAETITSKKFGYAPMPVFMLAKGNEIIIGDGHPLNLLARNFVSHPGGRKYPKEVDIHWQKDEETVNLAIRNPQIIEAVDLLIAQPAWKRPLLRLFSNPYYFRFNADLEMNVNLKNDKSIEHGSALFEIMILQEKKHP
jgi:predicted secreted hydrolase